MNELYESEQWRSLDEIDRAQLLLVIQGAKRGTIVGGNHTSFFEIVRQNNLDYSFNSNPLRLDPTLVIARPEVLLERERRFLTLPKSATRNDYHRIDGWFLGYPTCCTEEYVRDRTPAEQKAKGNGKRHLSYRFGRELDVLIRDTGSYPDVFDYCPPAFTPCSVDCLKARELLKQYKDVLHTYDPAAAEELVDFNRRGTPEKFAHRDYLRTRAAERWQDYRLQFLRRSAEYFAAFDKGDKGFHFENVLS